MANGLFDMLGANDQQPSYGGGFGNMSNSLIGLGMGLLTPYNAWKGESPYANALQGYMVGAKSDQQARQQQQELQLQRERMQLARETANREPESIRQLRAAGVPQEKWADYLYPKQDALTEGKITYRQQEYPYLRDRSGTYTWPLGRPPAGPGSLSAQPAAPAGAPYAGGAAVPFVGGGPLTTGAAGALPQPTTTGAAQPAPAAPSSDYPPDFDTWLPSAQKAYEAERARKLAQTQVKAPAQEQAAKQHAANALAAIDDAEKLATNKGGFLPTTGVIGGALQNIYQPGKDLQTALDTIKASVGFDRLQEMRASSPTGGALGPVSDFENRLLQSTIASLEQSQSPEKFKANLARVRATFEWVVNRRNPNEPPPFSMRPSAAPTTESGGPAGGSVTGGRTFIRDPSGKIVPQ